MSRGGDTRSGQTRSARGSDQTDDLTICVDAVRRLVRTLRMSAQRTQERVGVSAAQLFVLAQLDVEQELSLSELADRTLTDRTSVAAVVERLVVGGFVVREWSARDLRRAAVRITPAGRRLLRRAPEAPTTTLIGALESLPPAELRTVAAGLRQLTAAMGLGGEPAPLLFDDADLTSRRRVRHGSRPKARRT